MSFNFDVDKIMRQVTEAATDQIQTVLEEAKREMGADGHGITIKTDARPRRSGDKIDIGNVTFPSEEVKDRFLKIVNRKLR